MKNRKKLSQAITNKEYKIRLMVWHLSPCPVCMKRGGTWYSDCSRANYKVKHYHGSDKPMYRYKQRSYKSWKHNRKTQWK